jgi:hypothetical protein
LATYSDFHILAVKHVRRRGNNVAPTSDFNRATESHFIAQATHDVDGNNLGVVVIALTPVEVLPSAVLTALEGKMQAQANAHPNGMGR